METTPRLKPRYAIWGREHGSDHDVEIVCVNSNPEDMRTALYAKTLKAGRKGSKTAKYTGLWIVDHGEAA